MLQLLELMRRILLVSEWFRLVRKGGRFGAHPLAL